MNAVTIRSRLPMPAGITVTPAQWRVLCETIFPAAKSPDSIAMALDYCAARKLDPFKRPVHIVPVWNSSLGKEVETIWPGISELQVTAARTGQWAGMDEPKWGPVKKRTFKGRVGKGDRAREVTVPLEYPEWCAVTVYRMIGGQRHAFTEPVFWEESYSRQGRTEVPTEMWQKRTRGQLHKNAKAASLRAAFPEEMGNDYTAEEMEGKEIEAGGITIDGVAEAQSEAATSHAYDDAPVEMTWLEQLNAQLGAESNGTKWLKLLDAQAMMAPTREDAIGIAGLPAVNRGLEQAPTLIRERINEMLKKGVARFPEEGEDVPSGPDFMPADE